MQNKYQLQYMMNCIQTHLKNKCTQNGLNGKINWNINKLIEFRLSPNVDCSFEKQIHLLTDGINGQKEIVGYSPIRQSLRDLNSQM